MFDFAANQTVDAVEVVPEEFRHIYEEKDGAFSIAAAYAPLTGLASGLTKSLNAARAEAKTAKASKVDLSALKDYGDNVETIATTVQEKLAELNAQLKSGANFDPEKVRKEIAAGFTGQLSAKDAELATMTASLEHHLIVSEATRAITEAKGVPELLMPAIARQVKVQKVGARFVVTVVDEDGDARISATSGHPMTIADVVKELKTSPTYGRAFESEVASGGGKQPVQQTGRATAPAVRQVGGQKSSLDKISAGLTKRGS